MFDLDFVSKKSSKTVQQDSVKAFMSCMEAGSLLLTVKHIDQEKSFIVYEMLCFKSVA